VTTAAPAAGVMGLLMLVQRRARAGRCVGCGYDLRGMSGRVCPECGIPVEG
jgi:hypothetical protein